MILSALRTLARDAWVIGIAAAAALAYAGISLIEATIAFAMQLVDGIRIPEEGTIPEEFFRPPYAIIVSGRYVFYGDLVRAAVLFVVVLVVAALALRTTSTADEETRTSD